MKRLLLVIPIIVAATAVAVSVHKTPTSSRPHSAPPKPVVSHRKCPSYKLVILPLLPRDINNKGHIVGDRICGDANDLACIWINGKMSYLRVVENEFGGELVNVTAASINEKDQVVVTVIITGAITTGECGFGEKGKIHRLEGSGNADPSCINNKSQIVGTGHVLFGEDRSSYTGYKWDSPHKTAETVKLRPRLVVTSVDSINDRGDISGRCNNGRDSLGFIVMDGKIVTPKLGENDSLIINDKRQAVGGYWKNDDTHVGYIWENGKTTEVQSKDSVFLTGINNGGQAIGRIRDKQERETWILWDNGTIHKISDLAKLPPNLRIDWVRAINDKGQMILSFVDDDDNREYGYLLTPARNSSN